MATNVIHLPRPRSSRTGTEPLGLFIRVGRNDHNEILELISSGERGLFGFVIDARYVDRHKDLITEARKREFDLILDPKTQQMGLPGSYNDSLMGLPWGETQQHHVISDFDDQLGRNRAERVVEFALTHGFTQILCPSHIINDPNDPWLRRDLAMTTEVARTIERSGISLGLIYSLAVPINLFRDDARRSAIVAAVSNAQCDAIWLKIENFGDDASGEKTVAYIKACRDFHARGLPLVADHVGGLPGLGALAFGAIGGIAHGVTVNQNFKAASWRRPRQEGGGGSGGWRVYLPQLDMLVQPDVASRFISSSQRVRSRHVCRDTHCFPAGIADMLNRPARHAIYQRAREIEKLSEAPKSVRIANYLDNVRRVSDDVALAAGFDKIDAEFRKKLQDKQKDLGHFRNAVAHLATTSPGESAALSPLRRPFAGGAG